MDRLVIQKNDGSLSIEIFVPGTPPATIDATEARRIGEGHNVVGRITENDYPDAPKSDWKLENGVPVFAPVADNTRHFRKAWRWNGAEIVEDAVVVTEQRATTARAIRNQLLAFSDVEMMRANEQGAPNAAALENYRQQLRDMGPGIDADPVSLTWPTKPA